MKNNEIDELRKRIKELESENDELIHELDEAEGPTAEECVKTIYDICVSHEICRGCCFNRIEGCIITGSPYQWRMKEL